MSKSKKAIENEVKKQMQRLGTYKPEYDKILKIFAGMLYQYHRLEEQFEESGCKLTESYTNKAGATNERKVPLYTAMESLRKDIAVYSDKLCLNPKSLETVTTDLPKKSSLVKALEEISSELGM